MQQSLSNANGLVSYAVICIYVTLVVCDRLELLATDEVMSDDAIGDGGGEAFTSSGARAGVPRRPGHGADSKRS